MNWFRLVPRIYGKGLHVWLGIVLIFLVAFQAYSGLRMAKGLYELRMIHLYNSYAIIVIALVHVYYGLGLLFFGLKYRR